MNSTAPPITPDAEAAISAQNKVERHERQHNQNIVGSICSKQWQKGSDWVGEEGLALTWLYLSIVSSVHATEHGLSLGGD